jgi:PKD repeat protein
LSAPGNGTLVNASNRPFTLNGLNANTSYNVFVRDSCGPSDLSNWFGPITIQTRCAPLKAPYTQRFDGNNLNTGNFSGLGDLPSCWQRDSATSFSWDVLTGNGLNFQSGPSDDHSPSGANYLSTRRNNNFNDQSASTTVRMPPLDLDTLSRARIRFYYHVNDQNFDSLKLVNRPPGQGTSVLWRTDSTPQVQPGDPWLEEYVDLSAFTGDTIWLEWQASRNNTANFLTPEIAIDDIFIENAPLCQRPNQLVVSTLGSTTATLDWNSGGANNWQLEYGPPGFNPGSGTRINVTSKPFQITGLNPGKDYQIVVRDSCGANSLSRWTPPASFTTTCAVAQAPFLETFDGASFKIQTFNNNRGSISACWARSDSSAEYYWLPLDAGTNNTGPANDHTSGNGNFMATNAQFSGTANNAAATFTSPQIDLSPLNTPQLRFYEHRFGSDIDSLKVFVNDGTGWNQVLALAGANLNSGNAPWTEQMVSLSAYAGDTVQVRFRGVRTNTFFSRSIIGLDDFEIRESPSCPRPTQLNVTNTTNTSLTLDWTSSANNWIISYKKAGINNPQRTATASKPFTLTGLQPSTTYVITIQDSCGPNDISLDSDSLLARTDCGVANAPFTENFDGALWQEANFSNQFNASIDSCWSTTGADSDFAPGQGASGFNSSGPDQDVSGSGNYLYTPYDFQTNSGEITSPRIFIPNSLLNPYLKYGYFLYGSGISQFDVEISRVGSSGSTVLSSYTSQTQTSSTAAWLFDSLSLDAYQGDTVQITFTNNTSSFFSEAAIDAFELNGTPSPCSKPDSFQVSALSPTELSLSWTGQNNNSQGFTLIYYPVAQGTSGADTLSGLSSPYSLTNLNPNTNYRLLLLDSCSSGFPSAKLSQTFKTPVCPAVSASFTDSTQFLTAFYTASNTATADSLVWLLGNGDTSFLPNPQVNYSSSGSYSVTLKVFNDCGNIDSVTRNIQVCDTLQASFSYTTQGDTVVLDGSGSQNATSWRWLLGNGRSVGGQFALATFPNTNQSYPITLVVSNACGEQDSITQTVAFCDPPKADWTFSVLNPTGSGLRIQFDGTNSQNAQSYQWDFGDGATGTGPNPIHIYSTPGFFYEVTLVVTNDCGEQDSLSLTLQEVSLPEQAAFSSVEAYPNPAHELLQLRWNPGRVQLKTLLLRNSKGQAVQERQMENSGQERLDISRLPAGAYWLEIHSSTGARHSRTIIIE